MAKRRGNSEGTVYFHEPSGWWTGQATVGRHPVSGKPIRKTVYGETRQEVVEKLDEIRRNPPVAASEQALATAVDFWLGAHRLRVDPATAARYRDALVPALDRLGHLSLKDITAYEVTDLYRQMEAEGSAVLPRARPGRNCGKRSKPSSGWAWSLITRRRWCPCRALSGPRSTP